MKVLALGTSCVDVYPQKDTIFPGGEALNISIHLSYRKNLDLYLMGLIGRDEYADIILDRVKRYKINIDGLYQIDGDSAHHVIHIDKDGDRYFEHGSWYGGVSTDFSFNDNDYKILREVNAVITTLWEPNLDELVKIKNNHNYILAVDFNDQRDFTQWEDKIEEIDIFFSSAHKSMKETFLQRSKVCKTIFVLTFGNEGSTAYHDGKVYECPAIKVDNVIDTTGCGDCYQGHFLAEYLETGDIKKSMERATLEATKVTGYVGGFPAV